MTLGSLFDGIGTWQLAAVRAGITPVWSSEIEKFPREVSARHFPNSIQLGDINSITDAPHVDIVTASSPCQDISVAGKLGGIRSARSGLFFRATELVRRCNAEFFIRENVPNVININGGRDFQAILEEITQTAIPIPECGFANAGVVDFGRGQLAYRILDAQHFGVPQRRKRIFLVADFTGRRAAKILFEPASMRRNSATTDRTKRDTAAGITYGIDRATFNQGRNAQYKPQINLEICPSLTARGCAAVCSNNRVRRSTPLEEERLQGLPDNWTAGGSDSARYKVLGNALALPIAEFILRRTKHVYCRSLESF
ncbi:MAG: DNA (cytosine-5-)-methyltransferase [Selenomonadaceae bacterium]|nr:DNA (cytosine-5-)-methyltransferase [Selenomonadaceae bacterium]